MSELDMTLDQKFAKALFKLRELRPFYSAVYESIPHTETDSVDTMAVNGKELLYNKEWCDTLPFQKFMFVLLHEVCHIALMHVPRCEDRDNQLWNIAADLYTNRILATEFKIDPVTINKNCKDVQFLESGLYCSSVDIDKDTIEQIYAELHAQAKENGYLDKENSYGRQTYHFEYCGSEYSIIDKYSKFVCDLEVIKTYSGGGSSQTVYKVNSSELSGDLVDSGYDTQETMSENKRIMAEAQMKYDMVYKGAGAGDGSGILGKFVAELLKSHIDWRSLLRKYCRQIASKDTSFTRPDKRMYYQDAIYPGNMSEDSLKLERVKICFDRSGSISDTDMQYYYGQVKDMLSEFQIEAEVINWDTGILSTGKLSEFNKLKVADVVHGGGTNPTCLFRYFDSPRCKKKPIVTVIFTDGYINFNSCNRWKQKYKDTIWVMTRNYNKSFKPDFGKLAIAKFKD